MLHGVLRDGGEGEFGEGGGEHGLGDVVGEGGGGGEGEAAAGKGEGGCHCRCGGGGGDGLRFVGGKGRCLSRGGSMGGVLKGGTRAAEARWWLLEELRDNKLARCLRLVRTLTLTQMGWLSKVLTLLQI